MHIADPKLGIFGANGIVAAGLPIAVGAATAAPAPRRRQRRGGVLRRRRAGAGRVPRSAEPRRRVAAAGDLLLREQRLRRVLPGRRPSTAASLEQRAAGYGIHYVAVDGNDVVATAAVMDGRGRRRTRRTRSGRRRGRDLPLARPLRGRSRSATGRRTRSGSGRRVTRSSCTRAGFGRAGVGDDEIKALESSVADELDGAVEAARRFASPAVATLDRLRRPGATGASRAAAASRGRAGVPHHGRDPRRPRSRARRRRPGVRRRHRRRRGRQRLRAHARAPRSVRRSRPRHPDLRDGDHRASAWARRWPGCAPWSS